MMTTLLQVAVGGAIGATARYLTGTVAMRVMGPGFPWGTFTVNVVGSFLMGVLVVALAESLDNRLAHFYMTGLLGGFTTFSAFSLDALVLYERGAMGTAALYVMSSVVLSLLAIGLGLVVGRSLMT